MSRSWATVWGVLLAAVVGCQRPAADPAASGEATASEPPRIASGSGTESAPVAEPAPESGAQARDRRITKTQRAAQRWALLIGVDGYENLAPLDYCGKDARSLHEVLCRHGGYEASHVKLITDRGADAATNSAAPVPAAQVPAAVNPAPAASETAVRPTRAQILSQIDAVLADVQPQDTVLFAFSGHGMAEGESGYLMPIDGDPDRPAETAVAMATLNEKLKNTGATAIMMIDACHSGGTKGARSAEPRAAVNHRVLSAHVAGMYGLFSCDASQKSYEDPRLGHGVFTYYLIKALRGHADENGDRRVSVDEAHAYVSRHVPTHVQEELKVGLQTPYRIAAGVGQAPVLSEYTDRPASRRDLALHTFQGLFGNPWVMETPWLLPQVRLEIAASLPEEVIRPRPINGKIEAPATTFLDDPRRADVYAMLKTRFDEYVDAAKLDFARRSALQTLGAWDGQADTPEARQEILDAVTRLNDPHALAVYYAYFNQFTEARAKFAEALDAYARAGDDEAVQGLLALCRSDYARMLLDDNRNREAAEEFRAARRAVAIENAPLFHLYCLMNEANACRKLAQWSQCRSCLEEADVLGRARLGASFNAHPIVARLRERLAWQFMDQWRVEEAKSAFQQAIDIWEALREIAPEADRHQIQVAIFHDQHGQAMTERYSGQLRAAVARYSTLRDDVVRARDGQTEDPVARLGLTERVVNTMERLADCYLFGARPEPKKALIVLRQAMVEEQGWAYGADKAATRPRLLAKSAIARALDESPEAMNDELAELQTAELSARNATLLLVRDVAVSLTALRAVGDDPSQAAARQVVANTLGGEAARALDRDKLDLLLLLSHQLHRATSQTLAGGGAAPHVWSDAKLTFRIVPAVFRRPEVMPYLRQYFDPAIEACLAQSPDKHLGQMADFLSIAKTGQPLIGLDRAPMVVFYWPRRDSAADLAGHVLVHHPDGTGQVRPFATPLGALLDPAAAANRAAWPNEVMAMGDQETRVRVQWTDLVWGLKNEQFPFQLPAGVELAGEEP